MDGSWVKVRWMQSIVFDWTVITIRLVRIWPLALQMYIKQALKQKQFSVMKLMQRMDVVWLNGEVLFDNAPLILQNINNREQMKEVNRHDSIRRRQTP